jgi:hypothetical protein
MKWILLGGAIQTHTTPIPKTWQPPPPPCRLAWAWASASPRDFGRWMDHRPSHGWPTLQTPTAWPWHALVIRRENETSSCSSDQSFADAFIAKLVAFGWLWAKHG